MEAHWDAVPEAVPALRRSVVRYARSVGASPRALDVIALAASEAASNAVLHAFPNGAKAPELSVSANLLDDGHLRVVVSDNGTGMRERVDSPGLGLGLPIIDRLAEAVEVIGDGRGTHVRMDFALAV